MSGKSKKNKRGLPFEIHEYFKSPPIIDARKIIENMLLAVPDELLDGLGAVVICDTDSYKENYGDEEKISTARYIMTEDEGPPWIEICVDRLLEDFEGFPLKVPFFRDLIFSDGLYHEVGHHIHRMKEPENEDCEDVAERWRKKLQKRYIFKKYWYISIPLLVVCLPFRRILDKKLKSYLDSPKEENIQ